MKLLGAIKELSIPLYLILICLGYLEQRTFYQHFNIEIFNYLNVFDLAFYFVPLGSNVLTILSLLVIFYLPGLIPINKTKPISTKNSSITTDLIDYLNGKKKIQPLVKFIVNIIRVFVWFYIPICLIILYTDYAWDYNLSLPNWIVPTFMLHSMLVFSILLYYLSKGKFKKYGGLTLFYSIIIMFMFSFLMKKVEAQNILNGKHKKQIELTLKNGELKSSEKLYYLGETSEYIFLYHIKDAQTQIVPKRECVKILVQ